MKKILYLAIYLATLAGSVQATAVSSKITLSRQDYTFVRGVHNVDTTYNFSYFGKSGSSIWRHARTFMNLTIPQGATWDSAFYWTHSGSPSDTTSGDSCVIELSVYNGDTGYIMNDTVGWNTAYAAKATTTDTLRLGTNWTTLNAWYVVPFAGLKTVGQQVTDRPTWSSGGQITFLITAIAENPSAFRKPMRLRENGSTLGDSLIVYYTAGGGGGGGATPNTIVRSATIRSAILRAPDKNFYYDPKKETWKW